MHLKLPELGEGVHEGELVKWMVKEGDIVKDDQPLCEIMTDKATVELPAPFHGKITSILVKEGQVVHVGQEMLAYEGVGKSAAASPQATTAAPVASSAPSAPSPSASPQAARPAAQLSAVPALTTSPSGTGVGHVQAAPSTRRLARESGVELSAIQGSGPHGRVMREDVERSLGGTGATAAAAPSMAPSSSAPVLKARSAPQQLEERVPFRGLRKKIAEKMRLSKDHAAHFTYVEEADATELVNLRNQAKELGAKAGVKVTYLPFIMKAMVAALRKYPILNSSLDEAKGEIVLKHFFNIGISVQTDDGLTAPVIKDVGGKSVLQLAKEIQDVVERARSKKLTLDDLHGGTITLTNAGSIGGLFATPVINYPEVSILGFNKIFRKPVARTVNGKEEVVVRDWTYFSISLDHRVVDGAIGAEFMKEFIRYIETPSLLVLES